MFTGEYRHSVDEKGRVAVPARFRAQLDEGAVLCRWVDACLAIFPRSEWESLATKVKALPIADASARDFQRFLFAGAFEIELDRQGRFVLPAQSREWARLAGGRRSSSARSITPRSGLRSGGRNAAGTWSHPTR